MGDGMRREVEGDETGGRGGGAEEVEGREGRNIVEDGALLEVAAHERGERVDARAVRELRRLSAPPNHSVTPTAPHREETRQAEAAGARGGEGRQDKTATQRQAQSTLLPTSTPTREAKICFQG